MAGNRPGEEREDTMIMAWNGIVVGIVVVVGGAYCVVGRGTRNSYNRGMFIGGGITAIVIGMFMTIGSAFWPYGTEAGARAQKSWQSETSGGLTRVVTVYDMEGDQTCDEEVPTSMPTNSASSSTFPALTAPTSGSRSGPARAPSPSRRSNPHRANLCHAPKSACHVRSANVCLR